MFQGGGGETEHPCLKIYVASFPFCEWLKLDSLFSRCDRKQTSGTEGEFNEPPACFSTGLLLMPQSLMEICPFGTDCFQKYNLPETLYLTASPPAPFLHLLSSFMWRIKGFTAQCAAVSHLVHLSKKPSVPPEQAKQLHFLSLDVTRDLSHQS